MRQWPNGSGAGLPTSSRRFDSCLPLDAPLRVVRSGLGKRWSIWGCICAGVTPRADATPSGLVAQLRRAPACPAGGRRFESGRGRTESSAAGTLCILLRGLVLSPAGLAALSGRTASWRKRQTQRFQTPPPSPACGFESHRGYGPEKTTGRDPRRKSDRGPGSRKHRAASVQAVLENLHRRWTALRGAAACPPFRAVAQQVERRVRSRSRAGGNARWMTGSRSPGGAGSIPAGPTGNRP